MNGQYGWADALEILKAMKEGAQSEETRVERCNRLAKSRTQSSTSFKPQVPSSEPISSSAQWKQDAQEWEKQQNPPHDTPNLPDQQWDFEKKAWICPAQNTQNLDQTSSSGPMQDVWMQIHRSLHSLKTSNPEESSKTVDLESNDSQSSTP